MKATISIELIKNRLIKEIHLCNLTKTEIAKRVGIATTLLSQYEHKNKMPSLETFARICEVIGCDANYVLGLTDK